MSLIEAEKLAFSYGTDSSFSLEDIGFRIEKGELAVFLGGSGAGKTTLSRILDALLPIERGMLHIKDMDCADESKLWDIRRNIGIVFENFDDQIISNYAREDLGFAARNFLGEEADLDARIDKALELVGMSGYADCAPQLLPFFMRQRLVIAAAIVHDPEILILDEPFICLDEVSAEQLTEIICKLRDSGKTIILLTKDGERALMADRLFVMGCGRILSQGSPAQIFSDRELIKKAGIKLPFTVQVYHDLTEAGVKLERCPLSIEELVDEVCR